MRKTFKMIGAALIMSMMFASSVMGAEAGEKFIAVSGTGVMKVKPDIAYVTVGVRTTNADAETASQENIQKTNAIVEKLMQSGINEKYIKTQYYSVNPVYDYSNDGSEPKVKGYEVSNNLTVTLKDIDSAGKIIDMCISAGANMINGVSYSVEDMSIYYDTLYDRAVKDAQKKSSAIAKALGVTITGTASIGESNFYSPPMMYMNSNIALDASAKMSASTYTAPGDIELTANINISYTYQ